MGRSAQIFVCVGAVGRRKAGPYRHWDGDGSVPAGGTGTRCDSGVPRGTCEARRSEHFDYHQIESDCARRRRADEDCRAVLVANRHYGDDDADEAGAIVGATRAAAGSAARGGKGIARSGIACRRLRVAVGAGDYGWRRRARSRRGSRERSGRAVVFLGSAIPDAVVGETVPAVCAREISPSGGAVRAMVREEWIRSGRVPAQGFGTRGANPGEVWISVAAVGGKEAYDALLSVVFGMGCCSGRATDGRNPVLRGGVDA